MDLGHRQLNDRIHHKSFLFVTPPSSSHIPALMWNKQEWLVAHRRSFAQGAVCLFESECVFVASFVLLQWRNTWEWVFAYVRLFVCLKCPCLYGACQRSHGHRKHKSLCWRRCQKWHCDSRHGNKCWHLILGDCNWSCRFDYNFVLLCQGIVGSEVRLTPLLWSGLRSVACLDLH